MSQDYSKEKLTKTKPLYDYVSATDKVLGRVTVGEGAIEEITCTAAGRALLDDADAAAQLVTLGLTFPKFSANKNETNQTGVVTTTWTKVTFTTEEYDDGGTYDAANSKWVPGKLGKAIISACAFWTTAPNETTIYIGIYKNGVVYKYIAGRLSGDGDFPSLITRDVLIDNVADYFEIYVFQLSGSDKIISGAIAATYFTGYMLP